MNGHFPTLGETIPTVRRQRSGSSTSLNDALEESKAPVTMSSSPPTARNVWGKTSTTTASPPPSTQTTSTSSGSKPKGMKKGTSLFATSR